MFVVSVFIETCSILYGILTFVFTDRATKFVNRFFATMGELLRGKQLTTTYRPYTNNQVELFNKRIITRLRIYVAELQKKWDTFVRLLPNEYSTALLSKRMLHYPVPSPHLPGTILRETGSALPADGRVETSAKKKRTRLKARLHTLLAKADAAITSVQRHFKQNCDRQVEVTITLQRAVQYTLMNPLS